MQPQPRPEQQTLLDDYYISELVPEDHPLLEIDRAVDFSFVRELARGIYSERWGRPAVDPELLLRLCFLQSYYGLSDREVISRAQTDLALRKFLHLRVGDELPHPSLLSVFRRRLGAERFREVFNASVRQAVELGLVKSRLLMVDSCGVAADVAVASFRGMLMRLVRRGLRVLEAAGRDTVGLRRERAALETDNSRIQGGQLRDLDLARWMALAGQVRDALAELVGSEGGSGKAARVKAVMDRVLCGPQERRGKGRKSCVVSDVDPEARWARLEGGKRAYLGYKQQAAVDAGNEIITAVEVTPANVDDKKMLVPLVEQTKESTGQVPQAVVADKGYSSGVAREHLQREGITDLVAAPQPKGSRTGRLSVQDFQVDFDETGRPAGVWCPAGEQARGGRWHKARRGWAFYFHRSQCGKCPLRQRCTGGRRGRTIFIGEHHLVLRQARARSSEPTIQAAQKCRLNIERTFAFQKRKSGLGRARYRGLAGVSIQVYLACFMTNLVRIARAVTDGPQRTTLAGACCTTG